MNARPSIQDMTLTDLFALIRDTEEALASNPPTDQAEILAGSLDYLLSERDSRLTPKGCAHNTQQCLVDRYAGYGDCCSNCLH